MLMTSAALQEPVEVEQHDPALVRAMLHARESDRREGILFRQGRGWFQLPCSGHEPVAVFGSLLRDDDYKFLYYRDRALLLALGLSVYDLALEYFAKEDSSSGGRQMPSFVSCREKGIVSMAPPTGLQYLPAAGCAWACKLRGNRQVVLCSTGEAAVRQGEFYEALCFATEHRLPLVFLVEDNGWGISTRTSFTNPLSLGVLNEETCVVVDGRDIPALSRAAAAAVAGARSGAGPSVLWVHFDRLQSHSVSDDHRLYRSRTELDRIASRDPLRALSSGGATKDITDFVALEYERAEAARMPLLFTAHEHVLSAAPPPSAEPGLAADKSWTMAAALNHTLQTLISEDPRVLVLGQDVEDPKGGVFGVTKGLSTAFPGRVINAPLAEATIAGTASGLALAGFLPIFELQFIDFSATAFNQIVNQIATLRWRSKGEWTNPMILIAPCGAYLPTGGPWHSQSNEAWFAHAPGLRVVMPSTPHDAAALLRAAAAGDDPVLMLIPKHLLRLRFPADPSPVTLGEAVVRRSGSDVTVVAWGNCTTLASEAAELLSFESISAEVIDLRSLVPCDWPSLLRSLQKTGRLVVVQEDNRTCSFGQSILSEVVSRADFWNLLRGRPELVSRQDVHIGFHPAMEKAVLPSAEDVAAAARRTFCSKAI